jgi:Protein of unknown function (DUF667)
MFRNTFQKGFLSVFYSCGSRPLTIWDSKTENGYIKRILDDEAKSLAMEIRGTNVATCYISAPALPCKGLGVKLPFLTIVVKNLNKLFSFEIQILDDRGQLRRFRSSNYQSQTRITNFMVSMPLALNFGWNQVQLNLADFTRRAYGTNYMETVRVTINANCRLRNVYFSDRLYSDDEKPASYKFIHKEEKEKKQGKMINMKLNVDKNEESESDRPTSPISMKDVNESSAISENDKSTASNVAMKGSSEASASGITFHAA